MLVRAASSDQPVIRAATPFEDTFPISEDARYVQKFSLDEYGRVAEWAVVQMRRDGDRWRRVAVYDICHGKGVHLHLYDREEVQFTETPYDRCRSPGRR
jgi:hypothetical protein